MGRKVRSISNLSRWLRYLDHLLTLGTIAIIGSGISGMAAGYFLSRRFEVHLFEKDSRLGGHTHTHSIDTSRGTLPIDTGFIVHNNRTYPNLVRLFAELGVETQPSDMSFAVFSPQTGYQYSSFGLPGFFADPRNLARPSHYRLAADILRFNRTARLLLDGPADPELGDFLESERYSSAFRLRYLFPMVAAVWSTAPEKILQFPARTLLKFMDNHGLLSVNDHPQWKVVKGGSSAYVAPLTRPYQQRIYLNSVITRVRRRPESVTIEFAGSPARTFDHVVFACHGDQVLPLLADPAPAEESVFSQFSTNRNDTVLHTDARHLPSRRAARASWNYNLDGPGGAPVVTYHMNRLQSLGTPEDYCVTLNGAPESFAAWTVLRRMVYHHPLYTKAAVAAQSRWAEVSGRNRTHFCGAYWTYGFHEDGLNSALRVARHLGVDC